MARARAIETRLEKLLPSLDEYFSCGFLTREETVEVSRKRTHWEYRLVAKPLLLLDVRGAISYELGLENRLREYCIAGNLVLKHRWAIVERVESIYRIGLKHLRNPKEKESIRQELVLFLKKFERHGKLSNLYGELMVTHPRRSDIWIEAAEWQGITQRNADNARAIVQQALLTMSSEPDVWACALRIELDFVRRLLQGLLAEHRAEVRAKQEAENGHAVAGAVEGENSSTFVDNSVIAPRLRAENEAMGSVLLDLVLVKTVVEESLESSASGPVLVERLLDTACAYAFSRNVVIQLLQSALRKMMHIMFEGVQAPTVAGVTGATESLTAVQRQKMESRWLTYQAVDLLCTRYLSVEDHLTNQSPVMVTDTLTYLAKGGQVEGRQGHGTGSVVHPEEKRRAAVMSLVSLLFFSVTPITRISSLIPFMQTNSTTDRASSPFSILRRSISSILRRLAAFDDAGVSEICGQLLRIQDCQDSAALKLPTVVQTLLHMKKLSTKTAEEMVEAPKKWASLLLAEMEESAACHPPPRARQRRETAEGGSDSVSLKAERPLILWSVGELEPYLLPKDREVLRRRGEGSAQVDAAPLSAEEVDRLLVWWKEEETQLREKSFSTASEIAASRMRRRKSVFELLRKHGLIAVPLSASSSKTGVHHHEVQKGLEALLMRGVISRLVSEKPVPISFWRVFSALETVTEEALHPAHAPQEGSSSSTSSSDEDQDRDDGGRKTNGKGQAGAGRSASSAHFTSYAAAGLHFLAGVPYSSLDRASEIEWVDGVISLLRCRTVTLFDQQQPTREAVVERLRGATLAGAEDWIDKVEELLAVAQRCQPLPRQAHTQYVIPYVEGIAMYRAGRGSAQKVTEAVSVGRMTHESLLSLYGFTKNPESFIPLLFDGVSFKRTKSEGRTLKASQEAVQQANAQDWIAYVQFERQVAKDLARSSAVVERARRFALSPQTLMVKLSSL